MRTVSARRILEQTWALCTGDSIASMDARSFAVLRDGMNGRLETAWEYTDWPDLTRVEERRFRLDYASATTYAAGDEVYYPASESYYRALRSTTGNAPATYADAEWTTNEAYWWELGETISGDDWAASTAYAVGDVVRRLEDGEYYQCHTAHTSSSSFNATKFGLLAEFERYVEWEQTGKTAIGDVLAVAQKNPRVNLAPLDVAFEVNETGLLVLEDLTEVWVKFRLERPTLFGAVYDSAAGYAVGEQVYYRSATDPAAYPGEFYDCVTAASSGDSPETDTDKWTLLEIPLVFESYLVRGTYADWLRSDGQAEKATIEDARAEKSLERAIARIVYGSGQASRPTVRSR